VGSRSSDERRDEDAGEVVREVLEGHGYGFPGSRGRFEVDVSVVIGANGEHGGEAVRLGARSANDVGPDDIEGAVDGKRYLNVSGAWVITWGTTVERVKYAPRMQYSTGWRP
jgi:hypothetical protein